MLAGLLANVPGLSAQARYTPPPPRAASARRPALISHAPSAVDDDDESIFAGWLAAKLAEAPGANVHAELFADCHECVLRWRRRYRGNPRLWRSLMKADKVVKEIVEAAPVLAAARDAVNSARPGEKFTVVDLCCGKGFLSMILSELLPPERLEQCVLVDKAWPPFDWQGPPAPHHISNEHIYGALPRDDDDDGDDTKGSSTEDLDASSPTYFDTWPVPLYTSKQDLKNRATLRGLRTRLFAKCEGPVLVLAVHLCGTLALRAVELFNEHENVKLLALKPCCLPPMVFANRGEAFSIGGHTFAAQEVCASGRFKAGGVWDGPPRADLVPRFERWTRHLALGVEETAAATGGRSAIHHARVQVKGGYQNSFIFAERGPRRTATLWARLDDTISGDHASDVDEDAAAPHAVVPLPVVPLEPAMPPIGGIRLEDEDLVFDELPAPLEKVLLAEDGAAVDRGWATPAKQDACALLGAAGLDEGEQLSLTLCDDEVIRALNAEWRAMDKATDVLSFPMDDPQLLGDLVISLDTAERQAKERGHELRDELRILMVHGVLHLLGYDHETGDDDHAEMAAAERKLLKRLGWRGEGLIDLAESAAPA